MAEYFFSYREGLLAALMSSVSPFILSEAQDARMYPLSLLSMTLSFLFFYRALKENQKVDWLFYLVFTAMGLFTHYYCFMGLATQVIYYLLYGRRFRGVLKGVLLSLVVFFVLGLLYSPIIVEQFFVKVGKDYGGALYGPMFLINAFASFSGGYGGTLRFVLLPLFVLAFLLGMRSMLIREKEKAAFLLLWVVLPAVVACFTAQFIRIEVKYFIFVVPPYLAVVSHGVLGAGNKKLSAAFILLVVVFASYYLPNYYNTPKDDWRRAAEYLRASGGGVFVPVPGYTEKCLRYYGLNPAGIEGADVGELFQENITKLARAHSRVWVLFTCHAPDPGLKYSSWLDVNCLRKRDFIGIRVYLCEDVV